MATADLLPEIALQNPDAGWTALASAVDAMKAQVDAGTVNLLNIYDPLRCPSIVLDELGYIVAASIRPGDSDSTKRLKIVDAIAGHRRRGTWDMDLKPRIDSITGYSARLYISLDNDDDIRLADPLSPVTSYFWGTRNAFDGTGDDTLGVARVAFSTGTLYYISGTIAVDLHDGVHTAVLSAAEIQEIKDDLVSDFVPAYFVLLLGYTDTAGAFVLYSGGAL